MKGETCTLLSLTLSGYKKTLNDDFDELRYALVACKNGMSIRKVAGVIQDPRPPTADCVSRRFEMEVKQSQKEMDIKILHAEILGNNLSRKKSSLAHQHTL